LSWLDRVRTGLLIPVISLACGFAVAAIAVLLSGADPFAAFGALFQGAFLNRNSVPETLIATVPYIFLGLAVAIGFRGGLFNIGAEGQFYLGAVFGVYVGYRLHGLPAPVHITLALAAGMLGGLLWAAGHPQGPLRGPRGDHHHHAELRRLPVDRLAYQQQGPDG
jgi:simple sugar transport system permease protein